MRKIYVFLLTLVVCLSSVARQLTVDEAMSRIQTSNAKLRGQIGEVNKATYQLAYTGTVKGNNCLYVMNRQDSKGFVILGADDKAPALLAYNANMAFDSKDIPSNVAWWLGEYETAINAAIESGAELKVIHKAIGNVSPLMTSTWNQNSPYNGDCVDVPGIQSVTGCVATAMAQIMYYHKWPNQGVGSNTYSYNIATSTGTHKVTPTADFGSTTYNWSILKDSYSNGDTSESAKEVAKLLHHCGISVKMTYKGGESSASSSDVPNALIKYFDYDKGMTRKVRSVCSDEEWTDIIINEINAGRPVFYSGSTTKNEGHAFICDGYRDDGYFHFNWGWGGYCDGYYAIVGNDALIPNGSGIGGGTSGYGYTEMQEIIIGIQKAKPNSTPVYEMIAPKGCSVINSSRQKVTTASRTDNLWIEEQIMNISTLPFDVTIGLMFKSTTTDDVYYHKFLDAEGLGSSVYYHELSLTLADVEKNGTYEVYYVYRPMDSTSDADWKQAAMPVGVAPHKITVTGTEPEMSIDYAYVSDERNLSTPDDFKLHVKFTASKAVSNYDMIAWIFPAEGGSSLGYFRQSITLEAGESKEFVLPTTYLSTNLEVGKKYHINIKNQKTSVLIPSSTKSDFYVTIVSEIPPVPGPTPEPTFADVTFSIDGVNNTTSLEVGSVIPTPSTPSKTGYSFAGWEPAFVEGATVPDGGVTYTATWQKNKYHLFVEIEGKAIDYGEYEYESAIVLPSIPEKSGYTWVWAANNPTVMPASDVTLSGEYVKNIPDVVYADVTFSVDGQSSTSSLEVGSVIPAPSTPSKTGYSFAGWEPAFVDGATVPENGITYTATWQKNKYHLFVEIEGKAIDYGEYEYESAIVLPSIPEKSGYTWVWAANNPTVMPASDVTLSGEYVENVPDVVYADVTFSVDGKNSTSSLVVGSVIPAPSTPSKTGYTFVGWIPAFVDGAVVPEGGVTYTASWEVNKYTISYIFNGAKVGDAVVEYGAAIPPFAYTPEDSRYTIVGWRSDEDYATMPAKDITYTADFADFISSAIASGKALDIYTINGVKVATGVTDASVLGNLRAGLYIINGRKYMVK